MPGWHPKNNDNDNDSHNHNNHNNHNNNNNSNTTNNNNNRGMIVAVVGIFPQYVYFLWQKTKIRSQQWILLCILHLYTYF